MIVDLEKCVGCPTCSENCPLDAIILVDKKAVINLTLCVNCQVCIRVCPKDAISVETEVLAGRARCDACPIHCQIALGYMGACQRYQNKDGVVIRTIPLHTFSDVEEIVGPDCEDAIRRPLITGIGAGTTCPDSRPAPFILQGKSLGVDVVTVVTEAPLSYSGLKVKIDSE